MRNQLYPHWDRSSAWDPETLGALNGAIARGVEYANQLFTQATIDLNLPEAQKHEAMVLLAQGVSDGVMEFAETQKK